MSLSESSDESAGQSVPTTIWSACVEVMRIALPLMVSAGMFSVVLFADRTLLMLYDGTSMSASMAGGNVFWVLVCVPIGAASMTGATIGQLIGNGQPEKVGRLVWQAVWLSLLTVPWFVVGTLMARRLFELTGQQQELIDGETIYLRLLMLGSLGLVIESALSGFFGGIERTRVVMWVSVASGVLNLILDVILIFGWGWFPELGIAGAALGSVAAFWFKVVCYVWMMRKPEMELLYRFKEGCCVDRKMMASFLFFSIPSGLMFLTEAGAFTVIILNIGQLGDVPLRATTMVINFNMIAFIPLIGVAIATSVLVGRHLLQSGPMVAVRTSIASFLVALAYSFAWAIAFIFAGDWMLSLYKIGSPDQESQLAIEMASGLLGFVAMYVIVDAAQLIFASVLKGAGDTWFVLAAGAAVSFVSVAVGVICDPGKASLTWWWWVITFWIWSLAIVMTLRFLGGRWKSMRMVS